MPITPNQNIFSYSSNPLPIKPNSRKKYKEDDEDNNHFTLMSDPRVVRGLVSATIKKPLNHQEKIDKKQLNMKKATNKNNYHDEENDRHNTTLTSSSNLKKSNNGNGFGTYSYHVHSIVQDEIDVSKYLIEDNAMAPIMKIHETQTDEFQPRPITPEYIPRKTGIDCSTQVDNVNDLFIFDNEVEPMLHVIVSKTLEQSLFELEREAELYALQTEIEKFHHTKLIEQQWMKKREEDSIADACIKDLALKGMKEKQAAENSVREKVAARQTMLQTLPNMVSEIIDELFDEGIFKQPARQYISNEFFPQLMNQMTSRASLYHQVTELLDEILWEAHQTEIILPTPPPASPLPTPQIQSKNRKIVLTIHLPNEMEVGPIYIEEGETISSLQEKIQSLVGEEDFHQAMHPLERYLASTLGYLSPNDMDVETPLERIRLPDRIEL